MTDFGLHLDHVGVVVADLEAARGFYDRLGFQLTQQSSHKAAIEPGGPVVAWGSGNRCAMFQQGYFEIIGITDPNLHHVHIDERLARYHGLHLLAIGTDDSAQLGAALSRRLDGVQPMMELHRDVPVGDGTEPGLFRIVYLDDALFPEAEMFFIEHATRDVLWQPELLPQPNGVTGLAAATICSADPADTAARFAALVESEPMAGDDGGISFPLNVGTVELVDAALLAKRFPGVAPAASPWFAAVRFQVSDLQKTRDCLDGNGVHYRTGAQAESIWVTPDQAEGAIVEFRA